MMIAILAAVAALQAAPAAAPPAPSPLDVQIPDIAGAVADPTCGGQAGIARIGFCVATTQAAAAGLSDAYDADFTRQGWHATTGRENLTVYVRRQAGVCQAFQELVFTPPGAVAAPAGPAYFAFAAIPRDLCHAQDPAGAPAN